ncbi:MAG: pyruvate carboxylase subunit B [Proteobacteria bacterium]|nr:pyruvate carboxylase subunit B [Pseudomonadota bacterium]
MAKKTKNPVKVVDLTFRDGHQSLFATRMRTEDIIPIAEELDKVGFHSIEIWGGATFDVMHRFLGEDPWERPRILKKYIKNTPFQMLLRGQNLVGYRNYPDDVAQAFIEKAAEVGIDIFRVFDALNDERNLEFSFKIIKKCKKHVQGALSYTLTERKLGGEIFNIDYYVKKAKTYVDMGADSICIKDMSGILSPYDAYDLVKALKEAVKVPINVHSHYTSGMATMAMLKAVEAGADIIDTCISPFALRTSHPAVEPLFVTLEGTDREMELDLERIIKIGEHLEKIAPKYRHLMDDTKLSIIDVGVLLHQIPGGMFSNLVNQLREADALDKLNEVYKELPETRKELGYPPLVTPTSQIVGIQAVQNVLFGRWKMINAQVRDYCYGLYGRPPRPISKDVLKSALKGYDKGDKPIDKRPADILEPELEKAKNAVKDITSDIFDVLTYALFPVTGIKYLKWKYGIEPLPDDVKPKTLEDVKKEQELIEKAKKGLLIEKPKVELSENARKFNVVVDGENYVVAIEEIGGEVKKTVTKAVEVKREEPVKIEQKAETKPIEKKAESAPVTPAPQPKAEPAPASKPVSGKGITAPMPGIISRYEKEIGDEVQEGDVVVILEAMKMENPLHTEISGKIKAFNFKVGDSVKKGDLIVVIE